MNKCFRSALSAVMLIAGALCMHAQNDSQYRFSQINTTTSDLSYDGVSTIMQDSRGYIWIGTFDGLNRYDGSHFKVYRKAQLGLDSDVIHTIIEDEAGDLWIGTDKGLSRYIWSRDSFEPFTLLADNGDYPRNKVTFIYQGSDHRVWIMSNYQGVFCYNLQDGSLINYDSSHGGSPAGYRRMVEDGNGGFWMSRYHAGIIHTTSDLSFDSLIDTPSDPSYFTTDEIERLWMINGNLVVASNLHGITIFNPLTRELRNVFNIPEDFALVDAFLQDDRWVWLSTTGGVWKCDLKGEERPVLIEKGSGRFSINSNYVFSTFVDRDGGLWVGTKDGGVSYSGASQKYISKVFELSDGTSLYGSIINGITSDPDGVVWVSTQDKGLLRYDPVSGKAKRVGGLPDYLCKPCWWNDAVWVGSLNGLYRYDVKSGTARYYGHLLRHGAATDPRVYLVCKSASGDLYFANTLGLFKYNPVSDAVDQVMSLDGVFVTSIADAPDGTMWVSSYADGIYHMDPRSQTVLRHYRSTDGCGLPSDKVSSVFVDDSGDVWAIGFNAGLARLMGENFEAYDTHTLPSLPSDVFFCALQDSMSNLWLNCDKGVVKLNPKTLAVSVYTDLDGLIDNKTTNSSEMDPEGNIYIGSDNGFIHFNPMDLSGDNHAPSVLISKMVVGNRSVVGNLNFEESVQLPSSQNSFGFQFSVMSLSFPANNRVRCKLEGYDKDWEDVSSSKSMYYFNVPAGSYVLKIASSNSGSNWVESEHSLKIRIKPPFFASVWGILLILSGVIVLIVLTGWWIRVREDREQAMEQEALRKRNQEEAMRDKMNFFSHVVHEIKTPLTLIQTPLQSIIAKGHFDSETEHDLKVIQNNSSYLTSLVNELLEFVRVERQAYVLNRQDINLSNLLSSLIFNYSDSAAHRNIDVRVEKCQENVWVSADKAALEKILNNLLLNALKYAESYISITLGVRDGNVVVDVENDGIVIPEEFREDIFRPFTQYKGNQNTLHKGFGIGLPLALSLARMHSGDLVLLPGNDVTVFRFTMASVPEPVNSEPEGASNSDAGETEDNAVKTSERSRAVVLVVDDNEQMREFLRTKLENDFAVQTASNADAALAILSSNDIDLMVSDISMPGEDGLQLCAHIRADVEISHLPIIILSARTSVDSKIQAMEAGADLYVEKPFDLDYLRSCIRNILERRTLMRSALNSGIGQADVSIFGLPKKDEELLAAFDRYIIENIGDSDLSNEKIAEALCMSQSTLVRKIRKLLETSPNNYIRTKRLNIAARMLRDSNGNNISEICYSLGFTNVSYFAKCFKDQFGVKPSEWGAFKQP